MAVILIDADETIEGMLEPWVDLINKKYNKEVKYKDIEAWDISIVYPDIDKTKLMEILEEKEFWEKVFPLPGAVEYIKKLKDDGNEIYIVTSSHYKTIEAKVEKVLLKYFDYLTWDNIIICNNKQMIKGDILIDDYTKNLIGGDYTPILFLGPHNIKNVPAGIVGVHDWKECYIEVQKILKKIEK